MLAASAAVDARRRDEEEKSWHYSHDHLLAAQERVANELASSQGNGGVVVRHVVDFEIPGWRC